jgi:ribonuclease T
VYDTERTAQLFCKIVNAWPRPLPVVMPPPAPASS